jgi:hypothetical protein
MFTHIIHVHLKFIIYIIHENKKKEYKCETKIKLGVFFNPFLNRWEA